MGKQDAPHGAGPLDETYERIRRHGEAIGKDAEQSKREAAKAVHEERRQEAVQEERNEAASDDQRTPDGDRAPR